MCTDVLTLSIGTNLVRASKTRYLALFANGLSYVEMTAQKVKHRSIPTAAAQ